MTDDKFKIVTVISLLLIVGSLIVAVVFVPQLKTINNNIVAAGDDLAAKQSEYYQLGDYEPKLEEVERMFYSAKEVGEKIAEVNNLANDMVYNYRKYGYETQYDAGTEAKQLRTYISDRFPTKYDNGADWYWWNDYSEEAKHCKWEFATTFSYSANKVRVLWLCYQERYALPLAFVTAIYDAHTDTFSDIEHRLTVYGTMLQYDVELDSGLSEAGGCMGEEPDD